MQKQVVVSNGSYEKVDKYFSKLGKVKILLVCGKTVSSLDIGRYFCSLEERMGIPIVMFSEFTPNPLYEEVAEGVKVFKDNNCDMIVAVGGGSAIDVAKCIKLYANMDDRINYLEQAIVPNDIELMVVPTTAGTGTEATRYAVIYYNGEKQSVTDTSCIPNTVVFDASALSTLPIYQKKATMMDALCHAIESYWSVNSTEESRRYSEEAIKIIIDNMELYLANDADGNANMLRAAHIAGKAINITQTTAGHAMCYKLTSMYGIAHGHAVVLCMSKLYPYMVNHIDKCNDSRGVEYLRGIFLGISQAMGCDNIQEGIGRLNSFLRELNLNIPTPENGDYDILKESVNYVRLKNNPVLLDETAIDELYHQILNG